MNTQVDSPKIISKRIDQTIEFVEMLREFGSLFYELQFETTEFNNFLLNMQFEINKDIDEGKFTTGVRGWWKLIYLKNLQLLELVYWD